jgi:hypothetical protein
MGWSSWLELGIFALLAVGGARIGHNLARWSRSDDAREWRHALNQRQQRYRA